MGSEAKLIHLYNRQQKIRKSDSECNISSNSSQGKNEHFFPLPLLRKSYCPSALHGAWD